MPKLTYAEKLWKQFKREARSHDHLPYWDGQAYVIRASHPQANGSCLLIAHEPDELWAMFQEAEMKEG